MTCRVIHLKWIPNTCNQWMTQSQWHERGCSDSLLEDRAWLRFRAMRRLSVAKWPGASQPLQPANVRRTVLVTKNCLTLHKVESEAVRFYPAAVTACATVPLGSWHDVHCCIRSRLQKMAKLSEEDNKNIHLKCIGIHSRWIPRRVIHEIWSRNWGVNSYQRRSLITLICVAG